MIDVLHIIYMLCWSVNNSRLFAYSTLTSLHIGCAHQYILNTNTAIVVSDNKRHKCI